MSDMMSANITSLPISRLLSSNNNAPSWLQFGSDINGEATDDEFGWSISLSSDGHTVAVGAPKSHDKSGHVQVYGLNETSDEWMQLGGDINAEKAGDIS
eukprot:15274447-Ditylum_brightwellii.AAC.1